MPRQYTVRVAFLDVGQGDTIVVSIPETGEVAVIDCFDYRAVFTYLQSQNVQHIRGLIITHLHLDHYKGVVQFLSNCQSELKLDCERVIVNWPHYSNKEHLQLLLRDSDHHSDGDTNEELNRRQRKNTWEELKTWAAEHGEHCQPLTQNNKEFLDGTINNTIEVLQPSYGQIPKLQDFGLNNTSGILKIHGSGSNALLMGDLESAGWIDLQSKSADVRSDVLKFPHHGAWKDADPDILLDTIDPSIIVISVGTTGTTYNHPNAHVFEAIAKRPKVRLLCTQATEQCTSYISEKSKLIKQRFVQNTEVRPDQFYFEQSGCPCAGTVIIELGDSASVLQPHLEFHREAIIEPYFDTHKCVF